MRLSDGAIVPGNASMPMPPRSRIGGALGIWQPYRDGDPRDAIDTMSAAGPTPVVRLRPFSFTDTWKGTPRPVGDRHPLGYRPAPRGAGHRRPCGPAASSVGDNEPYDGALEGDTLDEEVTRLGIAGHPDRGAAGPRGRCEAAAERHRRPDRRSRWSRCSHRPDPAPAGLLSISRTGRHGDGRCA